MDATDEERSGPERAREVEARFMSTQFLPFYNKMLAYYRRAGKNLELPFYFTQNEMELLLFLYLNPKVDTPKRIAEASGMAPTLITRSSDSLLKKACICQIQDKRDRRIYHLKINADNQKMIDAVKKIYNEFIEGLTRGIPKEKMEVFHEVMGRMKENMERMG